MKSCFVIEACAPVPNNLISNCAENNDPTLPHLYKVPFHKERQNNTVTPEIGEKIIINYLVPFELVNATSASNIPYSDKKRKKIDQTLTQRTSLILFTTRAKI